MYTSIIVPGISGVTPSVVGGTGTSTKIFTAPPTTNWLYASYSSSQSTTSATAAGLPVPGNGVLEMTPFTVRASGKVYVHGTSPTINFVLQKGTSLTAASNTTFLTLASAASLTAGSTIPWYLDVTLQGDSTSGIVQVINGRIVTNGTSGSVTSTDLTGITFTTTFTGPDGYPTGNAPAFTVVCGVTFGVSDSTNTCSLGSFFLETAS